MAWSELRRVAPFAELYAELERAGGGGPVVDLGCGPGFWLRRMGTAGLQAVGVEPERARAREAGRQGPVAIADGTRLPLADGSVRVVWCLHVLHHSDAPEAVLAEARRALGSGGRLLLAESVEDNPVIRTARAVWPAWEGVPVRARFSAAELKDMVLAAGFEIDRYRQHSPLSFAGVVPPRGGRPLWSALRWAEDRLDGRLDRWGAFVDCVARAS